MERKELEEDINIAIANDNLNDFISLSKKFDNWEHYFEQDFEEYFIHIAIRNKAEQILKYMFDSKIVDINVKDRKKQTPLHLALEEGMCQVVQNILKYRNQEVEMCKDLEGNNELHKWVIFHSSCEDCLKYLSEYKSDKDKEKDSLNEYFISKNDKGNSPLHLSVVFENFSSFKLLVSGDYFNFNIYETGENNNSLLHLAAIAKDEVIY
jgi:ankyrin repeat protein